MLRYHVRKESEPHELCCGCVYFPPNLPAECRPAGAEPTRLAQLEARVSELEAELAALKSRLDALG